MKTKIFMCKVINSELQAAEYVSKNSSWGSSVNRAVLMRRLGRKLFSFKCELNYCTHT